MKGSQTTGYTTRWWRGSRRGLGAGLDPRGQVGLRNRGAMKKPVTKKATVPYVGFSVIQETMTDGWVYGAITCYDHDSKGCRGGDGFVVAPDGSRAGLDWIVGPKPGRIRRVAPPDEGSWGVYEAVFAKPVFTTADLAREFRAILPEIKRTYERLHKPISKTGA